MAPKYRILVVDDQQDVRNILRVGIESLGPDFSVVAVPSGEEAVLEITLQKFDLLVIDVRLPGISGLEVLRRIRTTHPDLRIILITGVLDPVIRRNVADAGADAFFLKPIEVSDFLDAVERCLGIVDAKMPVSNLLQQTDIPKDSVSERLVKLRRDLDAFAAILFDERGRVVVQAGELPDDKVAVDSLYPALMAGFSAGMKVSHFLGASRPESLTYFGGTKFALFFAPVSNSHALLVAVNAVQMDEQISQSVQYVYNALYDLQNILEHMGVVVRAEEPAFVPDDVVVLVEAQQGVEEDLEEAPILDAIFDGLSSDDREAEDLDAFWDSAAKEILEDVSNADVLSYEQALQLGLTPDDDEE
jgi:two-component system response regulator (stage 0 sporulation protein F)